MDKKDLSQNNQIENVAIENEMKNSFIDYSMSVIVSRAIPDARDGLKPIHRRILYAMNELEMTHSKAYKKSAKVVGEVLAKYHPHGDQAAYDSLVRMAQTFSLRYPLIDGQGNFGSIDGDSAAAMRYTESRLQKISDFMLQDINKDTVDFVPNYDASEKEPVVLPNKLPNLLINGSTGIAVGMATSIPPHNLAEVIDALIFISKKHQNKETYEPEEIFNYIKGPDFPTGGIILNPTELKRSYLKGRGRVVLRSKTELLFDEDKNVGTIIVKEIPYMVNKSNLVRKIIEAAKSKKVDSIANVSDESNRMGMRIVIKLKRGYNPDIELNKLLKATPLQTTFSINLLALDGMFPRVLSLDEMLNIFLNHQKDILIRKTNFQLNRAKKRIHILEGLRIALESIDRVIEIIKASSSNADAIANLMKEFPLSEEQSDAILQMKLSRLTGLETQKLLDEINDLKEQIRVFNEILESERVQFDYIIKDLETIRNKFEDERRTVINQEDILEMNDIDFIEQKDVIITMTEGGYIKLLQVDEYRTQRRGGMGAKSISTKTDDQVKNLLVSNTHSDLFMFTNLGRVYRIKTFQLPEGSKISKGVPIQNIIKDLKPDEKVENILQVKSYQDLELLFFTKNGIIKKTLMSEFENINRNGKIAIKLDEGDELVGVLSVWSKAEYDIVIGSSEGKMIRFASDQIKPISRTARGVKGIKLSPGHHVVGFSTSMHGQSVLSLSEQGFGKISDLELFRQTSRASKGTIAQNKKAGDLVVLTVTKGDEDLLIITNKGTTIRINLSEIRATSRNTKGVTMVSLKPNEQIAKCTLIENLFDDKLEEGAQDEFVEATPLSENDSKSE